MPERGDGWRGGGPPVGANRQRRMTLTETELAAWGRRIGTEVSTPVFIGIRGPLGAGKSVLARAVAAGAGVRGTMPSPTFNILFRYEAAKRRPVVHADLYRLRSVDELAGIGWDDVVGDDSAIVLVEWPERAGDQLPADRWEIRMDFLPGGEELRHVAVASHGRPPELPGFRVRVL